MLQASLVLAFAALKASAQPDAAWPALDQPAAAVGSARQDAAVIAAVERYAFVAPVPGARANGDAWYDYLTKTLGIPFERVALLRDADVDREELLSRLERAAAQAGRDGTLWFVFIGHGAPGLDGKGGALVGFDAQQKPASLAARSLPESLSLQTLQKSKAAAIRVVLDACFSGRDASGKPLVPGLQPLVLVPRAPPGDRRVAVLTAAQADQFAGPLPGADRPAFSYLALGALRGWAGGGALTAAQVVGYANKVLASMVRGRAQTAGLSGDPGARMARSPGEAGPDLAALQKSLAGAPVAAVAQQRFEWMSLPGIAVPQAPAALDRKAPGMDWASLDVDQLEAYDSLLSMDKKPVDPLRKAAAWRSLGQRHPVHKAVSAQRADAWTAYAARVEAVHAAVIARKKAQDQDAGKLCRLVSLESVPPSDKIRWVLQFMEAYDWQFDGRPCRLGPHVPAGGFEPELKRRSGSCRAGNAADCYVAAALLATGFGVKQDEAASTDLYRAGCASGNGKACTDLGYRQEKGLGVAADADASAKSSRKACELGHGLGCDNLANDHATGLGVPKDLVAAQELAQKACHMGSAEGCGRFAVMLADQSSMVVDPVKAVHWMRKSCDMGYALSCQNLALAHTLGTGGLKKDAVQTAALYRQACESGLGKSCVFLGLMHFDGSGVPADVSKAIRWWSTACELGNMDGCFRLAYLHHKGEKGARRDPAEAARLYRTACEAGMAGACSNLGVLHWDGDGVPKDAERAKELFRKSCELGDKTACDNAQLNP